MNEFNQTINFKFLKPADPNRSIGKLISFKNNGETIAHLSLTWESRLWFAYSIKDKFKNVYFPSLFNDYQQTDGFKNFQIHLDKKRLLIIQENFEFETEIDCEIDFDEIVCFEDFNQEEIENIISNEYSLSKFEIQEETRNIIETDVILTIYKSFEHINNMIDSMFKTINRNIINIINIIFCDNSTEERDIQKCKDIFEKQKNKYQSANWVYFKNDDETYVHSRITGLNKSLYFCKSEVISIFDTDIIFLSNQWCQTYRFYNQFDNATGCGVIPDQTNSNYYRDGYIVLRRFHPFFFHAKRDYLKKKVAKNEDYFGDFKLKTQYKNIEMNYMGLHFAGVYAEAKCDSDCLFKIIPEKYFLGFNKLNSVSFKEYNSIFVLHLEGMSFEETWKDQKFLKQKYEKIYFNCKNLVDSNIEFLPSLSNLMLLSVKKSSLSRPIFEGDLRIPDEDCQILVVVNKDFEILVIDNKILINNFEVEYSQEINLEVYSSDKFVFVQLNDDVIAFEGNLSSSDRFLVNKNVERI